MKPMDDIVPGSKVPAVVYAKDQPEYIPLPAWKGEDGTVVTRWHLSPWERFRVLFGGSIWLTLLTFNRPLQPVKLDATCPITVGVGEVCSICRRPVERGKWHEHACE